MRPVLFVALATCAVSACAMLPNPANEVSYTATSAKPNAPTLPAPVAVGSSPVANTTDTANSSDIISVVNAFIVSKDPSGNEILLPVMAGSTVKSGDVLEYQGLFTNNGDRVRQMDVTLSIADGLEFLGEATPKTATASLDNSRFVRMPIRGTVNGQPQVVPLSRYKALRWHVEDVGIGGTAVVKYRAKVK